MKGEGSHELQVALRCVIEAGRVCQRVRTEIVEGSAVTKADKSPVTVADFASQAVVCRMLSQAFPGDTIVAEETSAQLRDPVNAWLLSRITGFVRLSFPEASEELVCRWIDKGTRETAQRYWCLDPIDGTKGFLRGDQYAIALALVMDGKAYLGALACPRLPVDLHRPGGPVGVIFYAQRGRGAFQLAMGQGSPVPISVSQEGLESGIRFCESVEPGHADQETHRMVALRLGIAKPSIRMDSQAKYGIVARGDASIYLRLPSPASPDYREKVWDHAAGTVIVEEAGGKVTDILGKPLNFGLGHRLTENKGVVATSGHIHERVLAAVGGS
ncbi:MAG: 3'(2'),5'-bisphosphate nucleotidase [Thermodesulfobacteriota bacterium]